MDKNNSFREKVLGIKDGTDTFIIAFLNMLGLPVLDIKVGSWLLFFCLVIIAAIFIFAQIFGPGTIRKRVQNNIDAFDNEAKATRHYRRIYYIIVALIALAVVFAYIMGRQLLFRLVGAENVNVDISVILNLLLAILVCFAFILIIPLTCFIIYYLVKFVMFIVALIFNWISSLSRDINSRKKFDDEKYKKQLEEARKPEGDGQSNNEGNGNKQNSRYTPKTAAELFPSLVAVDDANKDKEQEVKSDAEEIQLHDLTLEKLALGFQSFAINKHKIYYELPLIRSFLAGLAASRLIILQGLSGTGKSMLPRMFKEYTGSDALFAPVQATWRDKTDVLGFYSEFTNRFKVSDFLQQLYNASYSDNINIMVLDELNLSRIEYYFADFISVMEYPIEDWKIKVYDPQLGQDMPKHLQGGYISVPANTYIVGTANIDDSVFTITDKVCDRAILLDFKERFSPIESDYDPEPVHITAEKMQEMFNEAMENENNKLNAEDLDKFYKVCDFVQEKLGIKFGNRIMVQIEKFVPVYVALGGTKEAALDFMFASKILRKAENSMDMYLRDELFALSKLISDIYGEGVFTETENLINKTVKRLG